MTSKPRPATDRTRTRTRVRLALLAGAGATLVVCGGSNSAVIVDTAPTVAPTAPVVQLLALSSKPEYVTGGDLLVAVISSTADAVQLRLNGTAIATPLKPDPTDASRSLALVSGLALGANTLEAVSGATVARLVLTNYPLTGPMLSGPQVSPFVCQTDAFAMPDGSTKLGTATDANCSAPTRVQYLYRSTAGGALKPMTSTTALPSDVATTTTSKGVVLPFVVRVETGTMNRGIYQNAVLHDPTRDAAPSPSTPPRGWNRKLIGVHGTGCATGWYLQGAAMGVSPYTANNLTRLGEGYAVFTNTLNHPTNSCNAVLAGETTLMGKERFIETFGVPSATVSVGTSGGAYTSLQVADIYPGVFDGAFIDATFPDALAIAMAAMDAKLLNRFLVGGSTSGVTEAQMVAVSGHKTARAWYDLAVQSGRTDPVSGRTEAIPATGALGTGYASGAFNAAVPPALRWNETTNPAGARGTVFDAARNVYGTDAQGWGRRPFDNVGVQYGLAQLNDGTLGVDQFLELNEKIGGYDNNGNYVAARTTGDAAAIGRAYQSGLLLNGGGGLASIPVFDLSNYYDEDNYYHYQWFHFAARERMRIANGDTRNHVMWRGGVSFSDYFGLVTPGMAERAAVSAKAQPDAWAAFVKWVDAYKADASGATQRDKVIAAKPAQAVDGCFSLSTAPAFIAETQTLGKTGFAGSCNAIWPSYSFPRAQAGGPVAADRLKCQLKPVTASDYAVSFSAPQVARLNAAFAAGTCDWSKTGAAQAPLVPYGSFGPSPVNPVFQRGAT